MTCPKCRAKVGIMLHEIIHEAGVVNGCRCVVCGYWKFDHPEIRSNKRSTQTHRVKRLA